MADLRILPGLAGVPDREDLEADRDRLYRDVAAALERLTRDAAGDELLDDADRLALVRQVERQGADLSAVRRQLAADVAAIDEDAAQEARHEREFYAREEE